MSTIEKLQKIYDYIGKKDIKYDEDIAVGFHQYFPEIFPANYHYIKIGDFLTSLQCKDFADIQNTNAQDCLFFEIDTKLYKQIFFPSLEKEIKIYGDDIKGEPTLDNYRKVLKIAIDKIKNGEIVPKNPLKEKVIKVLQNDHRFLVFDEKIDSKLDIY